MKILPGETCICHHASDGFVHTPSLEAKTSLTLHFCVSMAEHTYLHLLDMLIYSIRLELVL